MKNSFFKKFGLIVCSLIAAVCLFGGVRGVIANAEAGETASKISIVPGAAIQLIRGEEGDAKNYSGIRFTFELEKNYFQTLLDENGAFREGVTVEAYLIPTKLIGGDATVENIKANDKAHRGVIPADKWTTAETATVYSSFVHLYNIPESAYGVDISAFACLTVNGELYETGIETRSVNTVAQNAFTSGDYSHDDIQDYLPNKTVTFVNGGNSTEQTVKYGAKVEKPDDPVKDGETFLGWDYDFNTAITSDITITALWGVITLNNTQTTFTKKNETLQLSADARRDDDGSEDLVWESSNNDVATVDENGLVTAVGIGEAVITAKFEDGKVSATCAISCVDPYKNTSTGVHEYDFATGNVKITGKSGNENNDGANYLIDNMSANFAIDFTISGVSFDNDNDNFVFRLVSTHGRGTSMNLYWWNTRASIKVPSDSWEEHRHDPGTSLSQAGNYINTNVGDVRKDTYKVHFERYIDTEAATVTYAWIITNANGVSTMKVYTDKLSTDYCNTAEQTKGVGFSVWNGGGELTDSYTISDFAYTPDYAVASKLALSNLALEFTKAGEIALSHAETTETLVWSSTAENIATIDENGKVTAKAIGYASIVAKNANGTVVAACNVWCRDPYTNVNQGTHTYDFATGEVFITGSHGGSNNDVAYFNFNNKGTKDKLDDNFAVEFYAKSTLDDNQNYTIKVMSNKCSRGTAMNYNWYNTRGDYWLAGWSNWNPENLPRKDPGTNDNDYNIAKVDYVKVRLERRVNREAATIDYKITIWTAVEGKYSVIEFSDKINDNSNPDYTYAVGFGVKHTANDGKGIYVKGFTYTAL